MRLILNQELPIEQHLHLNHHYQCIKMMNSELYVGQAKNKYILDHISVEKNSIRWLDMV